jgi:hypothetical protein
MFPRLTHVTADKIASGGINKLIILYLRGLSRMKAMVAAAKATKLMTIQGAFACNRAIHRPLVRNSFPVPRDRNQLNITGIGASISDA